MAHERRDPGGSAGVSAELGTERAGADARFFGAEAERIAQLCRLMAERFTAGGRLLAVARSPRAWSDARLMVASVAEGDDKPGKYPLMFRTCDLVVINKLDLLEHVDFSLDRFDGYLDAVHPGVERMRVSARTGEGLDALRAWMTELPARMAAPA